jgi:hypothetical protein
MKKDFTRLIRSYEYIRYYRELRAERLRLMELPRLATRWVSFQFLPHYFGGTPSWRVAVRGLSKSRTLPDFALAAPIKSGSSDLASYILQHPCMLPPLTKELYSLDPDEWRLHYPTEREKRAVARRHGNALSGFFTTWLHNPELPNVLHDVRPNARIIALLRNPVDRFFSHYKWERLLAGRAADRIAHLESLEVCATMALERFPYTPMPTVAGPQLLQSGIYFGSLRLWLETFGREQVLVVKAEDFFQNPRTVLGEIHDFLGIPRVDPKLETSIINRNDLRVPAMNAEVRRGLAEFYAPLNQKLYELIGRDLGWN